ncbi:hypothetical protein [Leptospira harrisiae]|uniref:hypothetical protein n=1 Tax=Leptospira harrisiae TaxID=2023189 RepID=UPI000C2A4BB4|nr:hypothetical protein [Leptospira harrisiae]PKA06379.1 hypothetical protein CH366_19425 [Leptospira harrisiae]
MNTLINLISESLNIINQKKLSLSIALRNSIRISRLLNDFENLYFFEIENGMRGDFLKKVQQEIAAHCTKEQFKDLHNRVFHTHMNLRTIERLKNNGETEYILAFSIPELEDRIELLHKSIEFHAPPPKHIDSFDWVSIESENSKVRALYTQSNQDNLLIYEKLKSYVFHYLSSCEKKLTLGTINTDLISINKNYVENKLSTLNNEILTQFKSAVTAAALGDTESLTHSLTSCRRILKNLADLMYPASNVPIKGKDGKTRILTDEKYISRIIQFIHNSESGSISLKILVENIELFSTRIEDIYKITSKGVHADVTKFEVFQCLEQLYLLTGDLLRLQEGNSAILNELPNTNFK